MFSEIMTLYHAAFPRKSLRHGAVQDQIPAKLYSEQNHLNLHVAMIFLYATE